MSTYLTDLDEIRRLMREADDANIRFRQFVKYQLKWSDRRLDALVEEITREVQAAIDCTQCAHCCRALEVSLDDEDLARLAAYLQTSPDEIADCYTAPGTMCTRAFAQQPCAFLQDNRCRVYPARPRDCREYPHLGKGAFRERMWHLLSHAEDCPIVYNVLARLKQTLRPPRETERGTPDASVEVEEHARA